jgi:hypothetical protein
MQEYLDALQMVDELGDRAKDAIKLILDWNGCLLPQEVQDILATDPISIRVVRGEI